jgi:replicative DNA helicase
MELVDQRTALVTAWTKHELNLKRPIGLYGHDWGHHDWNIVLGGIVPSTITTLGAKSRTGKSAALIQVMKAAGKVLNKQRADILFFSWEMGTNANIERIVCHDTGITMSQYRYAKILNEELKDRITRAYSEARTIPVQYHLTSTNIETVIALCKKALVSIRGKEEIEGVKIQPVVVIDYVSMAQGNAKYGNKTYDINNFMQQFKQFANQCGIAGLFLAQVRRDAEGEPDLSHLQDSGAFEQNSDNVILMYRPETDMVKEIRDPFTDNMVSSKDRVMWRFLKTREGSPQDVLGHCDMRYFRFWHRAHTWNDNYTQLYESEEFWRATYGL